ncbi:GHKL domain-containing protein [Puteibacter caeruleilacunae]|nr:GHKL domain-containing protein [Puteibacter caeruleilacunae]
MIIYCTKIVTFSQVERQIVKFEYSNIAHSTMGDLEKLLKHHVIGHVIFWFTSIAFMLFQFYIIGDHKLSVSFDIFVKVLVHNIGFAIAVYVNLYYLFPKFLKQKLYLEYFMLLLLTIALGALFIEFMFIFPLNHMFRTGGDYDYFNLTIFTQYFFSTSGYVAITFVMKVVNEWIELQNVNMKLKEIEKQKLKAELDTLKAQINPHFFFNSLNNIYALALENSNKTPDLILKLSDLMRHVLYDSMENYILLDKEVQFIENYIDLQRIRVHDQSSIRFSCDDNWPEQRVAPLIFQPFIENAFKHGLKNISDDAHILINFTIEQQDFIKFEVTNKYDSSQERDENRKGIGIENVRKRLQMLYPKDEHDLSITQTEDTFSVRLLLKLRK